MLRVGLTFSLFGSLFGVALVACIDEPVYLGAGGGGGASQTTATGTTTGTASTSSTTGQGGNGNGGGSDVAPTPSLCLAFGGPGNQQLLDLRAAPNGTDVVGAGSFQGEFVAEGTTLLAAGNNDGFLARFDRDGIPVAAAQLGSSLAGTFGTAIVASQDRLIGVGQFQGTVEGVSSDAMGNYDLVVFDFDNGLLLAAGTDAEDGVFNGDAVGNTLYLAGDADVPGINLGTGALTTPGFVAGFSLASDSATFAHALGVGAAAGSGHNVRALPDGSAWFSVNLGGPGVTGITCDGETLVTTAARQAALLHIASGGECLSGRVLPASIVEDTDLFILDGKPGLSGSFYGDLIIDEMGVTAGGAEPDPFILTFDEAGNALSLSAYGGEGFEQPNEVLVTPGGSIIVLGEFTGTILIDDKLVATTVDGAFDSYLAKFTPEGEVVWATAFQGPEVQIASALAMSGEGHLFVGGFFAESFQCGDQPLESSGGFDMFMMRFDAGTL